MRVTVGGTRINFIVLVEFLFFFSANLSLGQGQNLQKKYEPEKLKSDIDSLVKFIEDTHPDPYFRYPKDSFYRDMSNVKRQINEPLSTLLFYQLIEPVIVKLEDGHTDLAMPLSEFYDLYPNPFKIPVKLKFSPIKPYISYQGPILPDLDIPIPVNGEILSINNISSEDLINGIIKMTSGESRDFRLAFGSSFLQFHLKQLYNIDSSYTITYASEQGVKEIALAGIREMDFNKRRPKEINAAPSQAPYSLKLMDSLNTALIDFRSFEDKPSFLRFADSTFSLLKERGVDKLIIDLRSNLGGDSEIGDEFLQYFIKSDFTQYTKVVTKYSQLQKERYKNNANTDTKSSAYKAIMRKKNGSIEVEDCKLIRKKDLLNRFDGKLIVLTSPFTFSSAADFAQAIHHYKLGTLVGQETGGLIVSFGDIITTHLPMTSMELTISHNLYFNIGAKKSDFNGVIPDHHVAYRDALNFALNLMTTEKSLKNN
ncbi:S41 family peptidase [Dyadobacter chenwenxiniae]|uniref:S41 family peptidase n=1 Tax=Dyadobacter chenwenxiniae TaxID=2906456 RepID=A0A9X1PI79_9BACT|nr:S41 family peptidase [Dyadobacter chenwenxiniae]MCF0060404.1 S41 family peptidase [Dyadobacter chenwenxiniae]UON86135.1 S41 family peptidase [Dyadobacter chenwenxiniae]